MPQLSWRFLVLGVIIGQVAGAVCAQSPIDPMTGKRENGQPAKNEPPANEPGAAAKSASTQTALARRGPSEASLREQLKQLAETKNLSDNDKKKITDNYQRALEQLKHAETLSNEITNYEKEQTEAPLRIKELRATLSRPVGETQAPEQEPVGLAILEKMLADREAKLDDARKEVAKWDQEPKRRARRRFEMTQATTGIRQRLSDVTKELDAKPLAVAKGPVDLEKSRRVYLITLKHALELELQVLTQRTRTYDATAELITLLRDQAIRQVTLLDRQVVAYRHVVSRRRKMEAEKVAMEVKAEAEDLLAADPTGQLRELAAKNEQIAKQRAECVGAGDRAAAELELNRRRLKQVTADFKAVQEKLKNSKMSASLGMVLRQKQEKLPNLKELRRNSRRRQQELAELFSELADLDQQRAELGDLDSRVQKLVESAVVLAEDRLDYEVAVLKFLHKYRDNFDAFIQQRQELQNRLLDIDAAEPLLIAETEKFAAFIADRVLWIPSADAIDKDTWTELRTATRWLFAFGNWRDVWSLVAKQAKDDVPWIAAAVLVFVGLAVIRGWLRRRLRELGQRVAVPLQSDFLPTLEACGITILLAAVGPLPLWFLGWRLNLYADAGTTAFAPALAEGLWNLAQTFLVVEFFRESCRSNGLAERHLSWPERNLKLLRRALRWVLILLLPGVLIHAMVAGAGEAAAINSLGRLVFIMGSLVTVGLAHRLFHCRSGILQDRWCEQYGALGRWLRYGLHGAGVGIPLVMAAIAAIGYYDTAVQLAGRLVATIWLGFSAVLMHSMLVRWMKLARRAMAIEKVNKKRTGKLPNAANSGATSESPYTEQEIRDLSTINVQTLRLVRSFVVVSLLAVLWRVWVEVLPALNVLNQVELWHVSRQVSETIKGATGDAVQLVDRMMPITLFDVIVGCLIFFMTFVASRNIPGLLEMSFLARLPLDSGGRYAITTICRYLISIVGAVMALNMVGIGWGNVQWMAAAISVGLGFGLQEIFANFISGLILLFERPIRVGDTVTIGEITGTVTKIRIRATTITDPDRKELIVPNKEFITGKLINWTLTDPTLRAVVKVSVAYGVDVQEIQQLLLDLAKSHPNVLRDPEPSVIFEAFGEHSLDFALRAFVPSIELLGPTRHELYLAVERVFREKGIDYGNPAYEVKVRAADGDTISWKSTSREVGPQDAAA